MLHRNRRPKRNAAPVYRVPWKEKKSCDSSWNGTNLKWFHLKCEGSWKGQFLNKNHITYDGLWKGENRKRIHIKCESSWKGKLLKRNHIKYDGSWKGQIWKKHSKCESSWQGNFLKRTGIEYNRSWKGQIWKDFITSNVKVPEREIFWNKNHIIYDSSWQRKLYKKNSFNKRKKRMQFRETPVIEQTNKTHSKAYQRTFETK